MFNLLKNKIMRILEEETMCNIESGLKPGNLVSEECLACFGGGTGAYALLSAIAAGTISGIGIVFAVLGLFACVALGNAYCTPCWDSVWER